MKKVRKIIGQWEKSETPLIYYLLTFLFATTLRNFLEFFSGAGLVNIKFFERGYGFWVTILLFLTIVFYWATRKKVINIFKVLLPSFLIINIAPLIDLLLSLSGKNYSIAYLRPEVHNNLLFKFFTFFGGISKAGVTPGMRIEIALVLIGVFLYIFLFKKNWSRALFSTLLVYGVIFFFLALPFFLKWGLGKFGLSSWYESWPYFYFYLVLSLILTFVLAYLSDKRVKVLLKDVRPWRLIHYELMFGLGLVMAGNLSFGVSKVFELLLIGIGVALAWIFLVFVNNIFDEEIDRISNPERPLFNKTISHDYYSRVTWFLLPIALICAGTISFTGLVLLILYIGAYCVYSCPPVKFKRVPVLSKLTISFGSLMIIMMGFTQGGGALFRFPAPVAYFVLVMSLPANFIDIKDYEGDKKAGIKTLPVLLGLKKAKLVIGTFFILTYLSLYFVNPVLTIPALLVGLLQFYLINREPYKEQPVFAVYLLSIIGPGIWWLL